mmetsp:Transcript_21604/g.30259  ORF Transcript_21604/g.30259 Transcript_21604/m.30259 type:complete len:1019 (-) Transcript_21604:60-3116(-)
MSFYRANSGNSSNIRSPELTPPNFSSKRRSNRNITNTMYPDGSDEIIEQDANELALTEMRYTRSVGNIANVGLSCLSPDGRMFHSYHASEGCIVTRFLPLNSDEEKDGDGDVIRDADRNEKYNMGSRNYGDGIGRNISKLDTKRKRSESKNNGVQEIRTLLPSHVVEAFNIDQAMELICVDNDVPSPKVDTLDDDEGLPPNKKEIGRLPLLCIYSTNAAFLLEIVYDATSSISLGTISSITEPFEANLLASPPSTCIIRIRPAPTGHLRGGTLYSTMCPKGSMAMLTSESSLVLFHGVQIGANGRHYISNSNVTTVPASMGMERVKEGDVIVDFCFLPSFGIHTLNNTAQNNDKHGHDNHNTLDNSTASKLFDAITAFVFTKHGLIYAVAPILFHGCVFPRLGVTTAVAYLKTQIETHSSNIENDTNNTSATEWRRAKAALQFFLDAFGNLNSSGDVGMENGNVNTNMPMAHTKNKALNSGGYYVVANVLGGGARSATSWPVSMQGPIFEGLGEYNDENLDQYDAFTNHVICAEIMSNNGVSNSDASTCCVMLGREDGISFVVVPSGIHLLPRFAFESEDDCRTLNSSIMDTGLLAEKIEFEIESCGEEAPSNIHKLNNYTMNSDVMQFSKTVSLVPDPVDATMLYHISKNGVITISTNVLAIINKQMRSFHDNSRNDDEEIKTDAWSLVEISGSGKQDSIHLGGIIVSGDVQLGHVLVASLSDGTVQAFNLTAAQYLREASKNKDIDKSRDLEMIKSKEDIENEKFHNAMEAMPPLYEIIEPLIDKVKTGLSKMGKIVGGSTQPKDVTPGLLATFLTTKQNYEKDVVLPLQELNERTMQRYKYLKQMQKHQVEQARQLQDSIRTFKEGIKLTAERSKVANLNADLLAQRSASVLEATRDLVPTITEAEHKYFTQLSRYSTGCGKWENSVNDIKNRCAALKDSIDSSVRSNENICKVDLGEEQIQLCQNLLDGEDQLLEQTLRRVKDMESKLENVHEYKSLNRNNRSNDILVQTQNKN